MVVAAGKMNYMTLMISLESWNLELSLSVQYELRAVDNTMVGCAVAYAVGQRQRNNYCHWAYRIHPSDEISTFLLNSVLGYCGKLKIQESVQL